MSEGVARETLEDFNTSTLGKENYNRIYMYLLVPVDMHSKTSKFKGVDYESCCLADVLLHKVFSRCQVSEETPEGRSSQEGRRG